MSPYTMASCASFTSSLFKPYVYFAVGDEGKTKKTNKKIETMAMPIADEHIDKLMRRTISPLAKLKRNIFDNSAVRFIFHMMLLFLASIAALRQNLTLDAPARSATQEYCSLLFPSYEERHLRSMGSPEEWPRSRYFISTVEEFVKDANTVVRRYYTANGTAVSFKDFVFLNLSVPKPLYSVYRYGNRTSKTDDNEEKHIIEEVFQLDENSETLLPGPVGSHFNPTTKNVTVDEPMRKWLEDLVSARLTFTIPTPIVNGGSSLLKNEIRVTYVSVTYAFQSRGQILAVLDTVTGYLPWTGENVRLLLWNSGPLLMILALLFISTARQMLVFASWRSWWNFCVEAKLSRNASRVIFDKATIVSTVANVALIIYSLQIFVIVLQDNSKIVEANHAHHHHKHRPGAEVGHNRPSRVYEDLPILFTAFLKLPLAVGTSATWANLVQYTIYDPRYGALVGTVKGSLLAVLELFLAVAPIFVGYVLFGMAVFGDESRFSKFSTTSLELFAVVNGDEVLQSFLDAQEEDLYETSFAATLYLFSFVIFFMYVVMNMMIAIIEGVFMGGPHAPGAATSPKQKLHPSFISTCGYFDRDVAALVEDARQKMIEQRKGRGISRLLCTCDKRET